jgi:hypothetical protein
MWDWRRKKALDLRVEKSTSRRRNALARQTGAIFAFEANQGSGLPLQKTHLTSLFESRSFTMRYLAFGLFFTVGVVLATTNVFGAGAAAGGGAGGGAGAAGAGGAGAAGAGAAHAPVSGSGVAPGTVASPGLPSAGPQNTTGPINRAVPSSAPPSNTPAPATSPISNGQATSNSGTIGTPTNTGSQFGSNGVNGGVNNGATATPVNPNQASSASGTLGTPPNTGSQFGANGVNGGVNNGATATPVNPNQASSASGTLGTPPNTGSQFGSNGVNGGVNNGGVGTGTGVVGNNPNVATHFGPNGEVFRGDSRERAALNRNRAFRFFEGRWWFPLADGQWMYWNGGNWVNYPAAVTPGVASAGGTVAPGNVSGQYSSGYRGVPTSPINNNEMNANVSVDANAASSVIGWYWRDGNWLWFNGQTFTAAR